MTNQDFKKMLIHKSYLFSIHIISFIRTLPGKDIVTEVVVRQVIRSATSIGANIVEAQAASSKKDFIGGR